MFLFVFFFVDLDGDVDRVLFLELEVALEFGVGLPYLEEAVVFQV